MVWYGDAMKRVGRLGLFISKEAIDRLAIVISTVATASKSQINSFQREIASQLENPGLGIFSMIFGGERYNLFYGVAKETSQNENYRPLRQMHRVA